MRVLVKGATGSSYITILELFAHENVRSFDVQ